MTSISSWLRSQPLEEMVQHYIWRIRSKTSSYTLCNRWSANSGRVEGLRDRVLGESWGINVLWCKGSGSKRYWLRRRFVLLVSLYGWYVVMLCNIIILIYIYIYIQCMPLCFRMFQQHPGWTNKSSELVFWWSKALWWTSWPGKLSTLSKRWPWLKQHWILALCLRGLDIDACGSRVSCLLLGEICFF